MSTLNALILVVISIILGGFSLLLVFRLFKMPGRIVFIGLSGTITGLIIGSLFSIPLSKIPDPFGDFLPIIVSVISVIASVSVFLSQKDTIGAFLSSISNLLPVSKQPQASKNEILVDTSVLIDGRLIDIAKSGFICGKVIVPKFVLRELQIMADKGEKIKREKGRRGLETLEILKNKFKYKVEVVSDDAVQIEGVDEKLLEIAKKRGSEIITTDYNLNKVAKIQGIKVLNINELSNAVRPIFVPGEEVKIKVVQQGKEKDQGVGYLPDGTMIVVEGGEKMVGKEVYVEVSRIFQTVAGKMIFAAPICHNKQRTKNKKQQ